jgi:hypothetical protein
MNLTRSAFIGVPAMVLILVSGLGCEERSKPAPSQSALAASGEGAVPSAVDWAAVTAAHDGSQIMAYKTLARKCDGWYHGAAPVVTFRYGPAGTATADGAHSAPVSVAEWKGIVEDARHGLKDGSKVPAVASKSSLYAQPAPGGPSDTFGTIPRYRYDLEAVDDNTVRFVNKGKYDDGV